MWGKLEKKSLASGRRTRREPMTAFCKFFNYYYCPSEDYQGVTDA